MSFPYPSETLLDLLSWESEQENEVPFLYFLQLCLTQPTPHPFLHNISVSLKYIYIKYKQQQKSRNYSDHENLFYFFNYKQNKALSYIRLQIKVWSNTKLLFQLKCVQLVGTLSQCRSRSSTVVCDVFAVNALVYPVH